MTIYIDSAIYTEVESARSLGWVRGVTTNPILLAKARGEVNEILTSLASLKMDQLFYQLVAPTLAGMHEEMELAAQIVRSGLVLKVPPTEIGFQFISQVRKYPCCVTAVYSPSQALIASEVKAKYVAVYVNRATRLIGDGLKLIRQVAEILRHTEAEIIAASLKSSEEACAALSAGAHHLTLPYQVLTSLVTHPLTAETLQEFQSNGVGITSSIQGSVR